MKCLATETQRIGTLCEVIDPYKRLKNVHLHTRISHCRTRTINIVIVIEIFSFSLIWTSSIPINVHDTYTF